MSGNIQYTAVHCTMVYSSNINSFLTNPDIIQIYSIKFLQPGASRHVVQNGPRVLQLLQYSEAYCISSRTRRLRRLRRLVASLPFFKKYDTQYYYYCTYLDGYTVLRYNTIHTVQYVLSIIVIYKIATTTQMKKKLIN